MLPVIILIEKYGADIYETGQFGQHALMIAGWAGRTDIVKYFQSENERLRFLGAVVNKCPQDESSLGIACKMWKK